MSRIADFLQIYKLYRRAHSPLYAARIAYGCTFRSLPF
jgi:hypothetical protein